MTFLPVPASSPSVDSRYLASRLASVGWWWAASVTCHQREMGFPPVGQGPERRSGDSGCTDHRVPAACLAGLRPRTTCGLTLSDAFLRDVRARGITYAEVAQRSGLDPATVSAAAHGASVNMTTATRLARAIKATPIVPELANWVRVQESQDRD